MIPLRILAVEDGEPAARELTAALKRLGCQVTAVCYSGEEAIAAVERQRPDLVLMNPAGGGAEAAVEIQRRCKVPVVFLMEAADEAAMAQTRLAQPADFVLKPFQDNELYTALDLAHARHRAQIKLQASEERFLSTLRSMAEGVISTDVTGVVNFMNPVAESLTGWTLEEAIGRPLHEVFRVSVPSTGEALDAPELVSEDHRLLRTILLTDRFGNTLPVEDNTRPIRDATGALTGIVVLFRRREGLPDLPAPLPEALAQSPWPNLAGIVNSIADPLLALDADWRITYLNAPAAEVLNGTQDNLLGAVVWDELPADAYRRYYHDFSTALVRREPASFEMEHVARGTWFEVQVYPFGSDGLLALLRDITERRRREEHQSRMEKLEALGLLARGFAHEFNNLLTVLLGHLSQAETRAEEGSPARAELRTARQAAVQAQGLVQQLLTFARGGAPIRQATNPARLMQEWLAEWPKCEGVEYLAEWSAGDRWRAEVDRHQVRRLLSNLVKNAEQAMPRGGTVWLRLVQPAAAGMDAAELGLPEETDLNRWMVLEVTDNGEGIAEADLPHLFKPYFTTRAHNNASGLGLTVCESIAKAHDGAIRVISPVENGRGTRVRVCLPAHLPEDDAGSPPGGARPPAPARGRRVLILEDEPLIRQLIRQNLEAVGCEVTATADGAETVSCYTDALRENRRFDLVIMDLSIPGGMGGAQAMELIRAADPGVCAVVSSGYSDDPVMARFRDYGFRAVLPKPYEPRELRETVEEILRGEPAERLEMEEEAE